MSERLRDLKAEAYDILAQIEHLQRRLQETNREIAEEIQKSKGAEDGKKGE